MFKTIMLGLVLYLITVIVTAYIVLVIVKYDTTQNWCVIVFSKEQTNTVPCTPIKHRTYL